MAFQPAARPTQPVVPADSNADKFCRELSILHNSAVGVVLVRTREPLRAVTALEVFAQIETLPIRVWSMLRGWAEVAPTGEVAAADGLLDPLPALLAIGTNEGKFSSGLFIMVYPHFFLNKIPPMIVAVKEYAFNLSAESNKRLILVVPPGYSLPAELEDDVLILDFDTPSRGELVERFDNIIGGLDVTRRPRFSSADRESMIAIMSGMSAFEAETALSRAIVTNRPRLPAVPIEAMASVLTRVKVEMVKRSEILEVMEAAPADSIGGLDNLKAWLAVRAGCFSQAALDAGVDQPKGMMLVGPPGCLSGDTVLNIRRGQRNSGRPIPIAVAYGKLHGEPKKYKRRKSPYTGAGTGSNPWGGPRWDRKLTCYLPALLSDRIGYHEAIDIVQSGVKVTYTLTADNGESLRATAEHPFKVPEGTPGADEDGFKRLSDLRPGDRVVVRCPEKSQGGRDVLATTARVVSIEPYGEEMTYDVLMEAPYHNYVAHGFVVHNTGKSLVAKATASMLRLPLIRFDVGRVFNSLVGESEARVRGALKMVDSMSPLVLMIDEVDKAFQVGAGGDSGVGQRVLGAILTWMQETKSMVFTVATANRVDNLPSEFLRRGRLDEVWSVSVPSLAERLAVLQIHLRKRGVDPAAVAGLEQAAVSSEGFVPAEIEGGVKEAKIVAFSTGQPVTGELIVQQLQLITPLSVAFREQFEAMAAWARNNARPANVQPASSSVVARRQPRALGPTGGRALNIGGDQIVDI